MRLLWKRVERGLGPTHSTQGALSFFSGLCPEAFPPVATGVGAMGTVPFPLGITRWVRNGVVVPGFCLRSWKTIS